VFTDPAGQFSFDLPLRLVYQPVESTLTTVTFRGWNDPSEAFSIAARMSLTSAAASWDEWTDRVAEVTETDRDRLTLVRRGRVTGLLAHLEDDAAGGRSDTFVARGVRIDVQARHWPAAGVDHPGPSDAFERIWQTLSVPANSFLPTMQSEKELSRLLDKGRKDGARGRRDSARQRLQEVRRLAQTMYLYALADPHSAPEIPAVQYIVAALANLFQLDGDVIQLRDADQLAWRAYAELAGLPVPASQAAQVRTRLEDMIRNIGQLHPRVPGEEQHEGMPYPGWGTARMRVIPYGFEIDKAKAGSDPQTPPVTELCEALVRDLLTWQLGQEITIRADQAGSMSEAELARMARTQSRYVIFPSLVNYLLALAGLRSHENDPVGSADASALAAEIARDVASDDQWRKSATEGGLTDPLNTLARALCLHASSLWTVHDEQSLSDAETDLVEAARIADELADQGELRAQICRQQAGLYLETERKKEALEVIERGLRACQNLPPTSAEVSLRTFRASCLLDAGDIDGAEAALKDLRYPADGDQFAVQHLRADAMFAAATVQAARGQTEQALAALAGALETVFKLSAFDEQAMRMLQYGGKLEVDRRFDLALKLNLAAIAALEARRATMGSSDYQVNFDESQWRREAYANLAGLLMLVDGAQAMAAADMGRARVLADLLGIRAATSGAGAPVEPPPELTASQPDQALETAADYVLRSADQVFRQQGSLPQMTGDEVRDLARTAKSTVLMIQPYGDTLALFLLAPSGEVRTRLSQAHLDEVSADLEQVNAALRIFTVPRGGADAESSTAAEPATVLSGALHRLWQALIEPVAAGLPERGPLIVVPYRDLALVPYALLQDADGNRLIDRFTLEITPSLAILADLIRRGPYRGSPQRVYLAGDPAVDREQLLPALSGALQEVGEISERLRRAGVSEKRIALRHGVSASLESYRSEAVHCDLVHLACHGRLEEPAASSRLYLAAGPSDDGLLLAAETSQIPLDDALVFLSACQTGQGRPTADGVIGFGRAFLQAGARAVVASLWKVADAATCVLAGHFYDALLTGSSAAEALQKAMLALRDDLSAGRVIGPDGTALTPEPANWAAFFAFGDALSVSYAETARSVEVRT